MARRAPKVNPIIPLFVVLVACFCLFFVVGGAGGSYIAFGKPKTTFTSSGATLPKGRYIKIEHTKKDTVINLTDFHVLNDSYENISQGKTVTANSVHSAGPMANLVDGKYTNFAHTNGPNTEKDWIEIDLGEEHEIRKFVMLNRHDCCKDRAIGVKVKVYDKAKRFIKETPVIEEENIRYTFEFNKNNEPVRTAWK